MKKLRVFEAAVVSAAVMASNSAAFHAEAATALIRGDLNRDDRTSVSDMVILKNHLLGRYGLNDTQRIAADINGDCTVDSLDLSALQDIILSNKTLLPKGTWIADRAGSKRYFSFGEGTGTVIYPNGSSEDFTIGSEEDILAIKMSRSGKEDNAFITWQNDNAFVLKWDDGTAETFRFFSYNAVNASEMLSGKWVTSAGRNFEISGLSGKVTDKSGNINRFEYAPDGNNIVFHIGSTDNNTEGTIVHTDSMHFTVTWADGTKETFTRREIEVKNGITYVNGILIANKTYSLPSTYDPGKILPEAQSAFDAMAADAKKAGYSLSICSGYRSYSYQNQLYNGYVARDGKAAADTYSARAGHSEHQTGLAMDINNASSSFNGTPQAKWIAANCYKYGFIIRYPEGKENITGYMYESWHVRYLGKQLAKEVYDSGLTLEEFLCIDSKYKS